MTYILSDFFPGASEQEYRDEIAAVHPGEGLPEGQLHHFAGQSDDGVLIVTIWDSKESADRFLSDVLMPRVSASNGLRGERQHLGAVGF
ncbi:hypothetical protein H8F24_04280 [Synechococcus sp. CBW1002]|uniref:hypothetical protein n=1 Tax=Synechococcus sp. CBW1002 TaxID=1353134 RepID=UPI0018CDFE64|nr:hypothetical protein [Synechococcus sp. CBW1002]QPN60625.1 hypothetical protein H8F24_04280 [Synechococcus sp. CBW1002]